MEMLINIINLQGLSITEAFTYLGVSVGGGALLSLIFSQLQLETKKDNNCLENIFKSSIIILKVK